jgi:hypothetical protein
VLLEPDVDRWAWVAALAELGVARCTLVALLLELGVAWWA